MIRALGLLIMLMWSQLGLAHGYRLEVDLSSCPNDLIKVRLYTPSVMEDEVEYLMPAIVPGTYARYDFGRFIKRIQAFDTSGKKIPIKRKDHNHFIIRKAKRLAYLEYWVSDTWDETADPNFVFQPAGLNFDENKSFALNFYGLAGYLRGLEWLPYRVYIKHPAHLLGSCALEGKRGTDIDGWVAATYHELADSPALYAKPDTASFKIGQSLVEVAVNSPVEMINARFVAHALKPIANALKDFFGTLPVNRYVFLMQFENIQDIAFNLNSGTGALEHNYSSFYYLSTSTDSNTSRRTIRDVATHEFLHILTPLNIHSKEIENFDFEHPKMSEHLWMYEGVTEYFSHLIQLRSGLISQKKFMEVMREKILAMQNFQNVSFTEMSKNILTDEYKNQFPNVYEKGAILAFMLDIQLNRLTEGRISLQGMMKKLADRYGPKKAFDDQYLFGECMTLTHPRVGYFFSQFVSGNDSLPLGKYFNAIGYDYYPELADSVLTYGKYGFSSTDGKAYVEVVNTDASANAFMIETGDCLIRVNGKEIDPGNLTILDQILSPKPGDRCTLEIKRKGKKMIMKASPSIQIQTKKCIIKPSETVSEDQIQMREWVLD